MGHARPRPKRLAEKLLQIRLDLNLSQSELAKRLDPDLQYPNVSKYELDKNEPPLMVLLAYSRVSGIPVENLIDDERDLEGEINN